VVLKRKKETCNRKKTGSKIWNRIGTWYGTWEYGTELEHDMELENSVMGINFPTQFHFSLFWRLEKDLEEDWKQACASLSLHCKTVMVVLTLDSNQFSGWNPERQLIWNLCQDLLVHKLFSILDDKKFMKVLEVGWLMLRSRLLYQRGPLLQCLFLQNELRLLFGCRKVGEFGGEFGSEKDLCVGYILVRL